MKKLLFGRKRSGAHRAEDGLRRCTIWRMRYLAAAAIAVVLPLTASAETFRCGKWIIDQDTTREELLRKCGPPASRESRVEDVRAPNVYTGGNNKVGETVIETWTYDLGAGKSPMVVILVDGQVKKIERKPR
jgi:hypothetical protein